MLACRDPHDSSPIAELFPWPTDLARAKAIVYAANRYTKREAVLHEAWQMIRSDQYPDADAIAKKLGMKFSKVYDHIRALQREGLWGVVE